MIVTGYVKLCEVIFVFFSRIDSFLNEWPIYDQK